MKRLIPALALTVLLAVPSLALCAPMEIAGIRLGYDIGMVKDRTDPAKTETDLTRQYLTTATLKPIPGFRSGYVTYGNCSVPGRIVRVKMNYEDDDRAFFDTILAALKKRYGEPQQWRGNPFGTLRIWKWSLRDKEVGEISIILQHYSGDDDSFTKGNSIRIAATKYMEEERACYLKQHPKHKTSIHKPEDHTLDLDYFLPQ